MKRALLLPPVAAAILFTIPQAWQMLSAPGSGYVPVVYELLLLLFSYLAALVINGLVIVPLFWLLLRFSSPGMIAGLVTSLIIALIADIVAYAFEIFGYQTSIFHPFYLYRIFIPLLILCFLTFFLLTRAGTTSISPVGEPESTQQNDQD
jgi:hypothetical protein